MKERELSGPPGKSDELRAEIQRAVDETNAGIPGGADQNSRPAPGVSVSPKGADADLKVKRNVVASNFESEIEAMLPD